MKHFNSLTFLVGLLAIFSFARLSAQPSSNQQFSGLRFIEGTARPDESDLARTARPIAGSSRKGGNPVLFLIGDSTMRTGTKGNGDNGQWGWGYYAPLFFDSERISVENHALGGLSSRTFYRDFWSAVREGIRPGDYVIIQLGHNDSGPYDGPKGRSSILSAGHESLTVTNSRSETELVRSYGDYLRAFIDETRERGGIPILFTLTARNLWDADMTPQRKTQTFDAWISEIASEKSVPLVDHEGIIARKYAIYGPDKVAYFFYSDTIHTSAFGAEDNARSAAEGIAALPDCSLKDYLLPLEAPRYEVKRRKGQPALFLCGDSTMANKDSDPDDMWGWGSVLESVFNTRKIAICNAGRAGRSARTFLQEGRWDKVCNSIQKGDFVVIQFGHNDIGHIDSKRFRGEIAGTGEEKVNLFMSNTRRYEAVYSYGWYLRKFIADVREKGGIPILVSITPRNEWPGGKIERRIEGSYGQWCEEVVEQTGVSFIDMHNISADFYDSIGPEATKAYFKGDHTHSSRLGAERSALSFAQGLRKANHPLAEYLKKNIK